MTILQTPEEAKKDPKNAEMLEAMEHALEHVSAFHESLEECNLLDSSQKSHGVGQALGRMVCTHIAMHCANSSMDLPEAAEYFATYSQGLLLNFPAILAEAFDIRAQRLMEEAATERPN